MPNVHIHGMESPMGRLLLAWRGQALCALAFDDHDERTRRWLARRFPEPPVETAAGIEPFQRALDEYFAGELTAVDRLAVDTGGTEFQQRVWRALREIPAGATATYGELAGRLGSPGASRAVGLANGQNPVSIVVPCHRVIGAGGSLVGYGGGLDRKRWLLAHERALLFA